MDIRIEASSNRADSKWPWLKAVAASLAMAIAMAALHAWDAPGAIDTWFINPVEAAVAGLLAGAVVLAVKLPDATPKLVADERRLKQVLLNLLSNAVKFTLPGGRVQVEASMSPSGELALVVADTGIGIAPEDIPRVLAPFGQVESGLNRKYEGTGLGLTLTKALVELHGGRLDIDSVRGVGTKASAIFPVARVRPHDAEAEPAQGRGRLRRLKVASSR